MLLADAITDPIKDDVTIYELPGLNTPDAVVLPVIHGFWSTRPVYTYSSHRFEEFGLPFYVVLTKDEQSDYEKIYEKIRRKYSQFSDAEELRLSPSQPTVNEEPTVEDLPVLVDETESEEEMEEVVLTRRDIHPAMVTIRVQPYSKSISYSYKPAEDIEMPTIVDSRVSELTDLREFLRPPPPPRMISVAPSAMESVHSHILTPPHQPIEDSNIDVFEDVGELYSGQHAGFISQAESPPIQDLDDTLTDEFEDGLDETQAPSSELHFTGSDVLEGDDERSFPDMMDSDDSDENIPPSQIGMAIGRQHAPSPTGEELPSYAQLHPTVSTMGINDDNDVDVVDDSHTLKFGDALICEWSDGAYQHVFNSPLTQVHWHSFSAWIDPHPPPPSPTPKKKNIDLDDCLDEFAKEEELGQDDLWYCPRCKEHRQAKKTLELWRVPDIFVVHLKRFSANRGFRDKLDNLIDFPLKDLDLSERVGDKKWIADERGGEKLVYDLFAVDNHFGGLGGGHYTAHAQNFIDGKWYYFDGTTPLFYGDTNDVDSSVRTARAEDSVTSAAYLLFYKRRSEHPLGGNTSTLIAEFLANRPPSPRDSEDSATTSPKNAADRSSSPSPPIPTLIPTVKPSLLHQASYTSPVNLADLYAPLKDRTNATTSRLGQTSWGGGWSNRASGSVGFTYGGGLMSSGEEMPELGVKKNGQEDGEGEIEIVEEVPPDMTEDVDDVQVVSIDPMDETDQTV
jgi:hypothetical protein